MADLRRSADHACFLSRLHSAIRITGPCRSCTIWVNGIPGKTQGVTAMLPGRKLQVILLPAPGWPFMWRTTLLRPECTTLLALKVYAHAGANPGMPDLPAEVSSFGLQLDSDLQLKVRSVSMMQRRLPLGHPSWVCETHC